MNPFPKLLGRIAAPLLTLGLLGLYFSRQVERSSPGALAAPHAALAELRGNAGCVGCHGDGTAPGMERACLHCHETIRTERAEGSGFHGKAAAVRTQECSACHREHRGADHAPTDAWSWNRADVKDWRKFDHAHVPFRLEGAHTALACTKCHPAAEAQPLPAGKARFAGLHQACESCHRDPHEGRLGDECAHCHGQEQAFAKVAAFRHDERFALTGGHGNRECTACHEKGSDRSLEALTGSTVRPEVRACAVCHANPHERGTKGTLVLKDAAQCSRCHTTTAFAGATFGVAEHAALGVTLKGRHAEAACAKCHGTSVAERPRTATEAMQACAVCHASPHRKEFADAERACAACHDGALAKFSVTDESRSRAAHAAIGVDLGPPHQKAQCTACHVATPEPIAFAARFPGRAMNACEVCHHDPHRGQLENSTWAVGGCLACHDAQHFVPAKFGLAEHASSRFPLDGAHAATACDRCHPQLPPETRKWSQAPFSSSRRLRPLPTNCAGCHTDPHGGTFDQKPRPAQVQGRAGCARCHTTTSFRTIAQDFDHETWTGYRLDGAHKTAACASCHAPLPKPLANGRTFEAAPRACAKCHADPHAGQFAGFGESGCARCHDPRARFASTSFDHTRNSRFRLDETHGKLSCTACHRAYLAPNGASIVRYKPLGTQCADCHDPRQKRGPK